MKCEFTIVPELLFSLSIFIILSSPSSNFPFIENAQSFNTKLLTYWSPEKLNTIPSVALVKLHLSIITFAISPLLFIYIYIALFLLLGF